MTPSPARRSPRRHGRRIQIFWSAAAVLDPTISGNTGWLGTRQGKLAAQLRQAGAADVRDRTIDASTEYADFTDWWSAYSSGIGPAGAYYRTLSENQRKSLQVACHHRLGSPHDRFTVKATCWFAAGTATT